MLILSPLFFTPVSCIFASICIIFFIIIQKYRISHQLIGLEYLKFIHDRQYWRIVSSSFAHISPIHLAFNLTSLWALRPLEVHLGSLKYFQFSMIILLCSGLMMIGWSWLVFAFNSDQLRTYSPSFTVGYSAVLFGLLVIQSFEMDQVMAIMGISVVSWFTPFALLILTRIFVPNSSFKGHLAGIVTGYLILMGSFRWMNDFLFIAIFFWTLLFLSYNLAITTSLCSNWVEIKSPSAPFQQDLKISDEIFNPDERFSVVSV